MTFDRSSPIILVRGFLLLGALLVLACDDDTTGPESTPPVLTISPSQQWAGGEVRISITGDMFEDGEVVVAGMDTLQVFDRQSFLLGVRLPTDVNGLTTLEVIRDGEGLGSVTVEAYGFEEHRTYPVELAHYITEFPVEWGVAVVGPAFRGVDTSLGITWIHLSTGAHRQFPGTPDLERFYRTGVDPVSGELFFEFRSSCPGPGPCPNLHRGKIVGGQLVDLGWVYRPCNRWGCEPLAGDIWIALEYLLTCRLVDGPDGNACEFIQRFGGDDPQWIRRLWSADVALIEHLAFRMSTGMFAYILRDLGREFPHFIVTTDEGRGLFYASTAEKDDENERVIRRIHTLRGADGVKIRSFAVSSESGGVADLAYDPLRDVLLIHRSRSLEIRDPLMGTLKGEVALPDRPDGWKEARILVDSDTDHAFIVYSGAWKDGGPTQGTPVISIRLPPL